ncbi:glycosyltransferase family 2 protein [Maricaulaceae bacterium EIL42A08]|nr:glycosyltransferase family 2 protein [Maricaulaceae bacterium EIL42A08]
MIDSLDPIFTSVATMIAAVIIATGLVQSGLYVLQLIVAGRALYRDPPARRPALLWRRYGDLAPPITLIAPAYNKALTIEDSVRSLLSLRYPSVEVMVVNDGSTDDTLEILIEAFDLKPITRAHDLKLQHQPIRTLYGAADHPHLFVVDKANGGKADALNAGINMSRAPVVCSIDADSILESDALLRAVRPFIDEPKRMIAVGGTVRLANGCTIERGRVTKIAPPRNVLALFQTVEYLRAFLMARLAWSEFGALTIISGAFGLFRRSAVIEAGGYAHGTVGEDMELVVRLHRHFREKRQDYKVAFVPEPVCWTEAPETLSVLGRQRSRWQRGALETYFKHASMSGNPRYGRPGVLGMVHVLLIDVVGPVIEALGYILMPLLWLLGLLSWAWLAAFLALTFTTGVAISVFSLTLAELQLRRFPDGRQLALLGLAAVFENFGYRQLNTLWRLQGWWQYLRKSQSWGEMSRKGFSRKS